jgi:hypothetical protein
MPFIELTSGLTIKVPTRNTTDWDAILLSDTFQKISSHDHSGSGNGAPIGVGSIADNAIDDRKVRLRNNFPLRSRDFAGTGEINLLKINASDKIELEVLIDKLRMSNNIALKARNFADSADIDLIKLDASDNVIVGGSPLSDLINVVTDNTLQVALTNNQSTPADITGALLAASDEGARINYRVLRLGTADLRESGELDIHFDGTNYQIIQTLHGNDTAGTAFSMVGGQLKYTTTDNAGSTDDDIFLTFDKIGA